MKSSRCSPSSSQSSTARGEALDDEDDNVSLVVSKKLFIDEASRLDRRHLSRLVPVGPTQRYLLKMEMEMEGDGGRWRWRWREMEGDGDGGGGRWRWRWREMEMEMEGDGGGGRWRKMDRDGDGGRWREMEMKEDGSRWRWRWREMEMEGDGDGDGGGDGGRWREMEMEVEMEVEEAAEQTLNDATRARSLVSWGGGGCKRPVTITYMLLFVFIKIYMLYNHILILLSLVFFRVNVFQSL